MKRLALYGFIGACTVVIFVLFLNAEVYRRSVPFIVFEDAELRTAEVILVLGAGVFRDGTLTPAYQDRVDTALRAYERGLAPIILVSGDNSRLDHNEVIPVKNYLVYRGVSEDVIVLDYAGLDTYDSMYRAHHIFGVDSAIVVTQSYHLPRAVFIARSLGIDAIGYPAEVVPGTFKDRAREFLAVVKAAFDVVLKSEASILGDPIPLPLVSDD